MKSIKLPEFFLLGFLAINVIIKVIYPRINMFKPVMHSQVHALQDVVNRILNEIPAFMERIVNSVDSGCYVWNRDKKLLKA